MILPFTYFFVTITVLLKNTKHIFYYIVNQTISLYKYSFIRFIMVLVAQLLQRDSDLEPLEYREFWNLRTILRLYVLKIIENVNKLNVVILVTNTIEVDSICNMFFILLNWKFFLLFLIIYNPLIIFIYRFIVDIHIRKNNMTCTFIYSTGALSYLTTVLNGKHHHNIGFYILMKKP